MRKIKMYLKSIVRNKNLIRHHILEDTLWIIQTKKHKVTQVFEIDFIAALRSNKEKRLKEIKYLFATGNLVPYEENGVVTNFSLSEQGIKNYFSDYFKEIGLKQIRSFWNNFINVILSIVIALLK